MQAKKRYLLVLLSCAFLAYCYFGGYRLKSGAAPPPVAPDAPALPSFLAEDVALNADRDLAFSPSVRRQVSDKVLGGNATDWDAPPTAHGRGLQTPEVELWRRRSLGLLSSRSTPALLSPLFLGLWWIFRENFKRS
jgi:hypothetical protein